MSDVRCQILDVRCQILDVECHMSDVRCQMSDVICQMSDVREQVRVYIARIDSQNMVEKMFGFSTKMLCFVFLDENA